MKVLKFFSVCVFSVLLMSGCIDDDKYAGKHRVSIATVENADSTNVFFLRLDNDTLLWTAESNFNNYKPKTGQRVIANYTLLSDKRATGLYDYDVKLNDVYEVLTKGIFQITPDKQDSIGHDSIYVSEMWIGSKYLNIEFLYQGYNKTHFINLVADTAKTYDDEKIHLEFRHNANNDYPMYNRWGIVSFDISSIQSTTVDSVNLVIHVNAPNQAAEELHELTYYYNLPSSGIIRKSKRNAFLNYTKTEEFK